MPIKIKNFGGPLLWFARKYRSDWVSSLSFPLVAALRTPKINAFIDRFLKEEETPPFRFLMLETVNRCNGKCSFCPANVRDEKRPYKRMTEELFSRIIDELVEINWRGTIFLQVNNEPFLDKRILDFAGEIRRKRPACKICIITNGTMLNVEKVRGLTSLVDELVINDYSEQYRLSDHLAEIYKYVKGHPEEFAHMEISISRRYAGEILATRAGNAPNKPKKNNRVSAPCIYPFTDLIIFPDGQVGLCCNDCFEVTGFGDVTQDRLMDIWTNEKFTQLRLAMRQGREHYPFCVECDVVDAGSREKAIGQG